MKTFAVALLLGLCASPMFGNPTGSPLVLLPVEPCRVLDTRTTLGALPTNTAMDVFVRGGNLPAAQGGQADCGIPADAEAVVVNVTAIAPTSGGHLKVNGTGAVAGNYSRLNYRAGENDGNELIVSLCNAQNFPAAHAPCPHTGGTSLDFQILNAGSLPGSSTHVIADVVGYLARLPITSVAAGLVVDEDGTPPAPVTLTLANGLRVVCALPFTDPENCDVEIGWSVYAAGHVVNDKGILFIFAHNAVGVDAN